MRVFKKIENRKEQCNYGLEGCTQSSAGFDATGF
jgi:hypothetical protein